MKEGALMNGWTMWFTGLPAVGKTTLAHAVRGELRMLGVAAVVLDSDEVRSKLIPAPTYSDTERDEFYEALVQLAALLNGFGVNVLIAATAPRRSYRDLARHLLPRFAEIWVRCPLSVCQSRDPKHLYHDAEKGLITSLPGVQTPYEVPFAPEVIIDSDHLSVDESVAIILEVLAPLVLPAPQNHHSLNMVIG